MAARRLPLAALGFAVAAALSSWNPLSAPFGVIVGLVAAVLAVRALVEGSSRAAATTALCLSLAAAIVSGMVLARTAGLGRRGPGESIVTAPSGEGVDAQLDAAAERTRAPREGAQRELQAVEKRESAAPPRSVPPSSERGGAPAPPSGAGQR
ncbi:hypothetical protein [Anaeromyxobacter terrae]|uniref:hypothetical protein n=1 Tax=Anaeromyxobacter terrae TaxID=2925406 RepID=UPI001F56BEA2|nr:hypothetical protein [Anaeromyxobacter sp. SG22]